MNPASLPAFSPFGESKTYHAFGDEIIMHLDGRQTGGKLALWTDITPPGGGPPPHYHLHEDECFIVLEGKVGFMINGEWTEAGPGDTAFMPRGAVHAFKNLGEQPSRMFVSTAPSGMETFFARCAEEFAKPGGPDMEKVFAISTEHGVHFVNP